MIGIHEMDFTGAGTSWQEVHPKNYRDLELIGTYSAYSNQGSFEGMYPGVSISTTDLEFDNASPPCIQYPKGGDAYNIWQYRFTGKMNMGIPYRIRDAQNPSIVIFYGVLDIANSRVTWEQDKVIAPLRQNISLDWFWNVINSLDFALLRQYQVPANPCITKTPDGKSVSAGQYLFGSPISNGPGYPAIYEYKVTAYQRTYDAQFISILSHLIHLIEMLGTLVNSGVILIRQVSILAQDAAAAAADPLGFGAWILIFIEDLLMLGYYSLKLVIDLAGVYGDILLLQNQVGLIDKYKYSMAVTDIIYGILTYINLQNGNPNLAFTSSIFGVGSNGVGYNGAYANQYSNGKLVRGLSWMPKKRIVQNQSVKPSIQNFVNGLEHPLGDELRADTIPFAYYGCPDGNVGAWLKIIMEPKNATINLIPQGSVNSIQLEEVHYWNNKLVNFTMPNEGKPGLGVVALPDPHKTNAHELCNNWEWAFMIDPKDGNTDTFYNGTSCSICTQPAVSQNILDWLNPAGKTIIFKMSLAKTKQWLSFADDVINFMIDVVSDPYNVLYGLISDPVKTATSILTGKGIPSYLDLTKIQTPYPYLLLTEDTTSVPKLFMGESYGAPPITANTYGYVQNPFWNKSKPGGVTPHGDCWQPSNSDSIYPDPNGDQNFPNESWVSADAFVRTFCSMNLATPAMPPFDPKNPYKTGYQGGNQWLIFDNKQFKICSSDFLNILQNGNAIYWTDGKTPCVIERIPWKTEEEMAYEVSYRINNLTVNGKTYCPYLTNLAPPTITIDGSPV